MGERKDPRENLCRSQEDAARRRGGQLDGWTGTRVGSLTRSERRVLLGPGPKVMT